MSEGKKVLIIGPGFIGWEILDLLITESYGVTGYVRRQSHASQLQSSGATTILGDLDDTAKITELTIKHDIVFHTATADHLPSAKAILDGIKSRADDEKSTIYIHTSGTSVLEDNAEGAFKGEKVYHDDKREGIDSVPDTALHREIDMTIVKAARELGEKAKIAIMIPPLIYGFNPSKGRLTIQIPTLTRFAIKHGWSGVVGKGLSVESQIHVMDLARGYVVLLHYLEKSSPQVVLENPYFFCENGVEASWMEVAEEVGKGLHKAGKIKDAKPREVPKELYGDLFGPATPGVIGLNSRSRAVRLRELGWEPREKTWRESYHEDELPEISKEEGGGFAGYTAKSGK
jgi:nucleoside-diphosphate-sugar epimerase